MGCRGRENRDSDGLVVLHLLTTARLPPTPGCRSGSRVPRAESPSQISSGEPHRQGHTSELAGTTNWEGRLMVVGILHLMEKVTM